MHLIIDLPISSTADPNGRSWYGSTQRLADQVKVKELESPVENTLLLDLPLQNPCSRDESNLGCQYYKSYGRLPLDFSKGEVAAEAKVSTTSCFTGRNVSD